VNGLPGKEEILPFQDRWMRPAGVIAILAAALIVLSGVLLRAGLSVPSDDAEQLNLYHDHSARLIRAQVVAGVGLALLGVPLWFLYRSARARSQDMRGFLLPLVIIGPLVLGIQGVVLSTGLKDASDTFTTQVPEVEAKAREQAAAPKSPEQAASDAKVDFAEDTIRDNGTVTSANGLGLLGGLATIIGSIYALIWVIRTGLLTRFWATVGMAFIVALFLIPLVAPFGIVLWFAITGLMLGGWWVRALPPAWAAGEAIPWPRPGEDIGPPPEEPGTSGTVEGSGREVSEPPLPEEGPPSEDQLGETQGQRRKKRKRRG
jgi:hypothetical protein